MQLSEEQKSVALSVLKDVDHVPCVTIGGFAGTGKSFLIRTLMATPKLRNYAVCAYTGKAANVLRKKGVEHASTIHGLIYEPVKMTMPDGTEWTDWIKIPDVDYDGFIVDEASMVSEDIDADLRSYGKPIIYVGDHGQLEPVNSRLNVMIDPMHRLETVHRNAGEIAHFADFLRKGGNPANFDGRKQVQVVNVNLLEDRHYGRTDQVICAYNKTRVELNDRVRKHLGIGLSYISVGEKVMCLRNNKKRGLFNGMQGFVERVGKNERFDFLSGGKVYRNLRYDPDQFGKETTEFTYKQEADPFDYAYAITAHKAQGDEWGSVIVVEQKCERWDHLRWAYTSASRARTSLVYAIKPPKFIPYWLRS